MKKAIVIGASSGIGKGLAECLVKDNYLVGITGRRIELLNEIKNRNPENYILKQIDVLDIKNTIKNLNELLKELGGVDMIIISSGTGYVNSSLDFEMEKDTIDVNVLGYTNVIDWAFNLLEKQNKGHLISISSVGGLRGSGESPSYNASKAYQINYVEGLRQKINKKKLKIKLTDIRPGLVDTAMAKGDGLFWVMPLEKSVLQMYRAIKSKKKVAYVTKRWGILANIIKILPRFIYCNM